MKNMENQIIKYFNHRNDQIRLASYLKFETTNEETLENLIIEYFIGVEMKDQQFMDMFSKVIDYMFDCYNG